MSPIYLKQIQGVEGGKGSATIEKHKANEDTKHVPVYEIETT